MGNLRRRAVGLSRQKRRHARQRAPYDLLLRLDIAEDLTEARLFFAFRTAMAE
jgi:hypothetical protein